MICNISPTNFIIAANVGMRRGADYLQRGLKANGRNSHEHDPLFDQAIFGAVAEFIVARILNLFWDPKIGEYNKGDVGGVVEVRCRNPRSGTDIGIHPDELLEIPFVGVVHRGRFCFEITGWIYGAEAKQRGVWNDLRQCYYATPPYRPIEELIALLPTLRPIEDIIREAKDDRRA